MAKRTSEASAPTVTVDHSSVVDSPAASAGDRTAAVASKIDDSASEVIRWGNGVPAGDTVVVFEGEGEQPAAEPAKPTGRPVTKPAKVKTDGEEAEAPAAAEEEETPAAASGKPKIDPERRKQILESLDREKNRVGIESRVAEEQKRAEAAEAKLAEFEKSPLGRKLATIAKQHGLTMDDLKDKLLIGADDVLDKEPAAAPAPKENPKVAELLKWKADREAAEGAERLRTATEVIRSDLKDVNLPMVDSFDAYGRVLATAHDFWIADGRKGSVRDYVELAGEHVEEKLREERPAAAKRLYREDAEETPPAAEVPAPRAPRPAMGKRTAARPGTKPAPLPDDPHARDEAIMKRYGWTR